MFLFVVLLFYTGRTKAYFTLPGNCPEKVIVQEDFHLHQFSGKWYQVYHYSSDELNLNNCAMVEMNDKKGSNLYFNFSRMDPDRVQRYSMGKLETTVAGEDPAMLRLTFNFERFPNKLKNRYYSFRILAINVDYFSTVYTCSYSPLINKHFIYVWILSRIPLITVYNKELAVRPLTQIGVVITKLAFDDWTKCEPHRYDTVAVEPVTFRMPVKTHRRFSDEQNFESSEDLYVWILSKIPNISDGHRDLAVRPLNQIGVASTRLLKDDWTICVPRSYSAAAVEPVTFRLPVRTHVRLSDYETYKSGKIKY